MPLDLEDTQLDFEQTNFVGTSQNQDIQLVRFVEADTLD